MTLIKDQNKDSPWANLVRAHRILRPKNVGSLQYLMYEDMVYMGRKCQKTKQNKTKQKTTALDNISKYEN